MSILAAGRIGGLVSKIPQAQLDFLLQLLVSLCLHIAVFVQTLTTYTKNIAAQVFPLVGSTATATLPDLF